MWPHVSSLLLIGFGRVAGPLETEPRVTRHACAAGIVPGQTGGSTTGHARRARRLRASRFATRAVHADAHTARGTERPLPSPADLDSRSTSPVARRNRAEQQSSTFLYTTKPGNRELHVLHPLPAVASLSAGAHHTGAHSFFKKLAKLFQNRLG